MEWFYNGELGFKIYRSTDNISYSLIDTISAGATKYNDMNLVPGQIYYYFVSAYDADTESFTSIAFATVFDITDLTWTLWLETKIPSLFQSSGGSAAESADDPIGEWQDQSGNGNHFVQATAGDKPSLQFINEIPVVRFSGDFLEHTTKTTWKFLNDGSPHTIIILFRTTDDADAPYGLMGNSAMLSTNIGFGIYWDNRSSSSPNTRYIWHTIFRGVSGSLAYDGTTAQNYITNQKWGILELSHQYGLAGNDGEVYYEGHQFTRDSLITLPNSTPSLDIQIGATGNDVFPANIDIVAIGIAPSILSSSDRQKIRDYLDGRYAGLFDYKHDSFVDKQLIGDKTGVLFNDIAVLSKHSGNPIFPNGTNLDTWDVDKHYVSVELNAGVYHAWYTGVDSSEGLYPCYATSNNGLTWTKPNLGLVSYGGDSNNNILLSEGVFFNAVVPDPTADFLGIAEENGVTNGTFVYVGSDRTTWSLAKTIVSGGIDNARDEGRAIVKRLSDYIAYSIRGHSSQIRSVRAFKSRTDDPTGDWDVAIDIAAFKAGGATTQFYGVSLVIVDDLFYALAYRYNSNTEKIYRVDLYVSRNGLEFTLIKEGILAVGDDGDWDDGMIFFGSSVIRDGDTWKLYYSGSPKLHNEDVPRDTRIGYASVPYERFGGISGTGTLTTIVVNITGTLEVNITGTLEVELLDMDGNVITNFSRNDCDSIPEGYNQTVTWNSSAPPTQAVKIKFYLTNAILWSWSI